ncbi:MULTISPECIES: extracellular solute-binding protein [Actibacterium]|uniref:Inositol-phosphate transport system substrate-binding protein n=1 Tax=Actibacterium naphthalenivorans TaxID=1614693 RepID=A0A840CPS4_9RHOB|nr:MULTISPECIES: extracellular solute-binding protein [Actibacterium]ALG90507.1 ABC transporter substrate-binding protein [Actibacterium sp. EMB200-NS6]MBB4023937.1 inositol-phosphate transport system substrate-binding protein [Actibacterium naphthalenivorans]
MSILKTIAGRGAAAAVLTVTAFTAAAEDYTITVWAGGTGDESNYRYDAIALAADILEREAEVRGEELNITVESQAWSSWDDFKQAFTLASEAGNSPDIVVSGHEDIGPWSEAGLIVPIEDYVFFDTWPLNAIYPNLIEVASYNGQVWGIPQDAEARVFYWSIPDLEAIGWSAQDIENLPARVESGEFTLYDMLDAVEKMQAEGVVDASMGFAPRVSNGPDYWQFYQSFGGEMIDKETGRLVLDTKALTGMYQFFVDAAARGVVSKTFLGTEWDTWHQNVAAGKYGAWHGGTWHYAQWTNQFGLEDFFDTVQYTLIPAGNENGRANSITHPLVYLVTSAAPADEAVIAAELISIASEPRINALHAVKSAHLGISEQQNSVPLYANDRWLSAASERLAPHTNALPNSSDFGIYWNAMYDGLEASWTGVTSVEDAVAEVEAQVTRALGDNVIVR